MSWIELFLGYNGRISRRTFWLASLVPALVHALAAAAHEANLSGPLPAFAAGVAAYSLVMLNSKRLHDLGKSGWMQLVLLSSLVSGLAALASMGWQNPPASLAVTIVALALSLWAAWIGLQIIAFEGQPETNRYGAAEESKQGREGRLALEAEVADIVARAEQKKAAVTREPTLDEILAAAAKAETAAPSSRFGRRRQATA